MEKRDDEGPAVIVEESRKPSSLVGGLNWLTEENVTRKGRKRMKMLCKKLCPFRMAVSLFCSRVSVKLKVCFKS